ncbi:helix-turn-helix domain-containing protein [[Eubacterium] hominis]|uniref:helix-turn-helix domain-containing protein n=1 Tax=[Eubacterium] hominis TaxID=2764325 RepID=UPI003A4DE6CE
MLKIGGIIKASLENKNMTQKQLGIILNVNQRTISSYCNDISYPDLDTLQRLCKTLDIDLCSLLELHRNKEDHLIIRDENEMKIIDAFRQLPDHKRKDFCDSMTLLASIVNR